MAQSTFQWARQAIPICQGIYALTADSKSIFNVQGPASVHHPAVCFSGLPINHRNIDGLPSFELGATCFTVSAVRNCFTCGTADAVNTLRSSGLLHGPVSYRPNLVPLPTEAFSLRDANLASNTGFQWGPNLEML